MENNINKIFVITDERCGGTELGILFEILGYKTIDDPQTIKKDRDPLISNKQYVLDNIEQLFSTYNYIKICMVSYTEDEYIQILRKVVELKCKIIFLWRRNFLERSLSKAIAIETGVWFKNDYNSVYYNKFKIDIKKLKDIVNENKKKTYFMVNYLKQEKIQHFPLLYENIYNKDLNGDQRLEVFYKILNYINPNLIKEIDMVKYKLLVESLCPCKKVNNISTYNRIVNINDIIKQLSNNENGILKLK